MIGKILGNRYEIIEEIGSGGMAIVYKAKCHLLNRNVAVKILRKEYVKDVDFLEKFKKEAQSAAGLSHQNIVNIYDVGMDENIPYIVMEYVKGVTLKEYIDKNDGFIKNEEIANFAKQIALALDHAHSNHIIHKDIKPHNILVATDKILKVADFGIASAISETTTSYSSEAIGSVRYTSPEQARGRNVDERTDIYSLGVLMYEMATRSVPFEGSTVVEIALKHMQDDIVHPTTINRCLNKGLESIILRSLLKDILERYKNAKEMIDDLDKIIQNPNINEPFYLFDIDNKTQKIPILDEYNNVDKKSENRIMKKKITKKHKKPSKNIIAIIGVVLLAFITVFIIFILLRFKPILIDQVPEEIILPDVISMSYENAKIVLEDSGFIVVEGISESNNLVIEGSISSQSPASGTNLKKGYKIVLNVSSGAIRKKIPNVVHKEFTNAKVIIDNSTFKLGTVTHINHELDKNYVLEQTPNAGVESDDGATIDLVVSLGPESSLIIMPSLIGKTINEVQILLDPLNINLNNIEYEFDLSIEKDLVITQTIAQGNEIEPGKSVDIVISKGVEGDETIDEGDEIVGEDGDTVIIDPNAIAAKTYNIPISEEYIGQEIIIKILYLKDNNTYTVYEQVHNITAETLAEQITISESGSGMLYLYINNNPEYIAFWPVDFSE